MNRTHLVLSSALALLAGCSNNGPKEATKTEVIAPSYFKVDPGTAGEVIGRIRYVGKKPAKQPIDMSEDPACVEAHRGKAYNQPLVVNANGTLANVFVYVKDGLEGKTFPTPAEPVTIDQHGCTFMPRVLGIQTGQTLKVTNSDPVTHNIHPQAQVNREWNHSQGEGDPPILRRFLKPEVMIRVKCNIHSWMHSFFGVVDHPYFAVTGDDGGFDIKNLPPGGYTLSAWQEQLGIQDMKITVAPSSKVESTFTFKGAE